MKKMIIIFAAGLFGLFHCVSVQQSLIDSVFKRPQISVQKISVKSADFEHAVLNMNMRVINSNNFPISVEKLQYKIFIYTNNKAFLSASQKTSLLVESMSTNWTDFLMDFSFSQIKNIDFSKKHIPYIVEGNLYINTVVGKIRIPFKHSGLIPIPQLPKISVEKVKVVRFSPVHLQASFLIGLSIFNPNEFPLKMKNLSYNFNLNGKPVIEQGENQNILIAPGATEYLNIVADFDLSRLKSLVSSILKQKTVKFNIDGQYQFDSKKMKEKFVFTNSGQTILEK